MALIGDRVRIDPDNDSNLLPLAGEIGTIIGILLYVKLDDGRTYQFDVRDIEPI